MRYGTVCSGIEAPSVAWEPLGWRSQWFSEIERFPSAVLAHHYPNTPNLGDMEKLLERDLGPIDLLCGGTPYQSFSVAGLRGGMGDPRGNLAAVFCALAGKLRPRWVVWENVPGVLSSNGGRDFGSILGALAELGYGLAYRVLDAQYFGLAQRRKRVFLVGYLGDWRRAAAVLFEPSCLRGDSAPSRGQGQSTAGTLGARTCRSIGAQDADVGHLLPFAAAGHGGYKEGIGTLRAHGGDTGDVGETLVAHALRAEGFDASEDGTGRGTPLVPEHVGALQATYGKGYGTQEIAGDLVPEVSPALKARDYKGPSSDGDGAVLVPVSFHPTQDAVAFHENQRGEVTTNDTAGALGVGGGKPGQGYPAVAYAIQAGATRTNPSSGPDGVGVQADHAYTLEARQEVQSVGAGMSVRRLTPRECERLQGFPDDYTLIDYRGKAAADGPRYKALGNSMAVPVMRWIGARIIAVEGQVGAQT